MKWDRASGIGCAVAEEMRCSPDARWLHQAASADTRLAWGARVRVWKGTCTGHTTCSHKLEPAGASWQVLLAEDTALCESIQHGLNSRAYSQGRFVVSPNDGWETERSVAHFHALCHASLLPSAMPTGGGAASALGSKGH